MKFETENNKRYETPCRSIKDNTIKVAWNMMKKFIDKAPEDEIGLKKVIRINEDIIKLVCTR